MMYRVNLSILENMAAGGAQPFYCVDGKLLNRGARRFTTESDTVEISIFTLHPLDGPWWFFTSLICFIIGIFGIFDRMGNRRCVGVEAKFTVKLTSEVTDLVIGYDQYKDGEPAVRVSRKDKSTDGITVLTNRWYFNARANKRMKTMRRVKALLILACLAAIATAIILNIV